MLLKTLSLACAAVLAATVNAQTDSGQVSVLEPPQNKLMLGVWLDTNPNQDTPKAFNQRFGRNAALVHMAEDLPLQSSRLPPVSLIDDTNTNAILYLSVYPTVRPDQLTDAQINEFVQQLGRFAKAGRGVLVRLAPEMNGSWQPYGQRPLAYVAMWRKIVTAIRANEFTPGRVNMIWAPNMGAGYPYDGGVYSMTPALSATEYQALDTNGDGRLTEADDPYLPFYPGNEYVDWVGLSAYWFGLDYPYDSNDMPTAGRFGDLIHGRLSTNATAAPVTNWDFYATFAEKNNKPFFVTESGAAFHAYQVPNPNSTVNVGAIAPGPGALAIKQAWWRQYLTNTTFLDAHPRLKAICLFEWQKPEETTFRDFQLTNDTAILAAFKQDFNTPDLLSRYIFAGQVQQPIVTDPESPKAPSGNGNGTGNGSEKLGTGIVGVAVAIAVMILI